MYALALSSTSRTAMSRPNDRTIPAQPFRSAEEAWLWTMAALVARREGARSARRDTAAVRTG